MDGLNHKHRLLTEEASQQAAEAAILFTGTDVQSSTVRRDQPQMGIAGIPGEGKCGVTTRSLWG